MGFRGRGLRLVLREPDAPVSVPAPACQHGVLRRGSLLSLAKLGLDRLQPPLQFLAKQVGITG